MSALARLTRAAQDADDAWQSELVRTYGRDACDARYDRRGIATPNLRRLCNDKVRASHAVHCAWCATRGDAPSALVLV